MKMRLYAALVSEPTDVPDTINLNGIDKAVKQMERLEAMVEEAWQAITTQRHANPPVYYQAVFVAPEYFFSNQRHVQQRFFSHDVKRVVVSRLNALAKKYPDLLIVPGTVLWTRDLFDTQSRRLPKGQLQHFKVANDSRRQKAVARETTARDAFGTETNKVGWSRTRNVPRDPKLAQNTAYICLGDKILKYHKVGNYEEVMGETDDIVFVPGSIVGRFKVGGVKYGIEVCMDHALGVLHSSVGAEGKVHIQIIVSSHVSTRENPDASVTVHSCTQAPVTFRKDDGSGAQTTGTNPIRFGGDKVGKLTRAPIKSGSLTIWVIDLDAPDLLNPSLHTLTSANLSDVAHIH